MNRQQWFPRSLCLQGSFIQRKLGHILSCEYIGDHFEVIWGFSAMPDQAQSISYSQKSFWIYWTFKNPTTSLIRSILGNYSISRILPDKEFGMKSQVSQQFSFQTVLRINKWQNLLKNKKNQNILILTKLSKKTKKSKYPILSFLQ